MKKPFPWSIVLITLMAFLQAQARAAEWTLDPAHKKLTFSATQAGTGFTGEFRKFDAAITFDPAHPEAARVRVVIDMASADSGSSDRDDMMKGNLWFDVKHYPQAVFQADKIIPGGADSYVADGRLTIRNVTRKASLPFTLKIEGNRAHAVGGLGFSRRDYGVGGGDWASDKWVGYPVTVKFDIEAVTR